MGQRGEGTLNGQIRRRDGGKQTVYGRTEEEARERLAAVRSALGQSASDPGDMAPELDELIGHRTAIHRVARSERASNLRVFGSVARRDSSTASDYDLVVDLDPEVRGFEAFDRLDRSSGG